MTIRELVERINALTEKGYIELDKEISVHNLEDGSILEICGIAFYDYGGIDLQAIKPQDEI